MSVLLLSETLPLRTTKSLGDFAEDMPLPHIYGDLRRAPFPLIRLLATVYFVADHPMQSIDAVYVDKQQVFSWAAGLDSDTDGHTWQVVTFAAPIAQASTVSATGRGKLNPNTGGLIENPADVIEDVLRIAGRADDWSDLRAEASGKGLTVAGRVAERKAIKSHIDDVTQSVAAIWTPSMARLYPTDDDAFPILDLRPDEASDIAVSTSLTDTADVLRLAFDWSDAAQKCQQFIEFSASPQRYGGLAVELSFPWLRKPTDAQIIGTAVLRRLNADRYAVDLRSTRRSVRPGMRVRPIGNPEWPLYHTETILEPEIRINATSDERITADGDVRITTGERTGIAVVDPIIMALAVEVEPDAAYVRVNGEAIFGDSIISVTAHSLALPDTIAPGVEVAVRDGVATFTVSDDNGKPLAGARVSLDGAAPKTTNSQGKVQFEAKAGVHELAIEAPGFVPFSLTIEL